MEIKIYRITNRINGKQYIGQTSRTLKRRFFEHSNNKKNSLISQAIRKYGKENFAIEQIDLCETVEQANEREQYYVALHNTITPNGYNLTSGGQHCIRSEKAHQNMSLGQKRRYERQEEHEKSSRAQKRRAQTPLGRAQLLAASQKAKELADEKRREKESQLPPKFEKKSAAAKQRAATPEGRAKILNAVAKSVASRAEKRRQKLDQQSNNNVTQQTNSKEDQNG